MDNDLKARLRNPAWITHAMGAPTLDVGALLQDAKDAADRIEELEAQLASRGWQPIETAPKDGTYILARHVDTDHGSWANRIFVVRHIGFWEPSGLDLGWSLFPWWGVGDEHLSCWMPLQTPPSAIPESVTE